MMADKQVCSWLMDNADTPIRYRTARELQYDFKTAKSLESALPEHPAVALWLRNLKPQTPPQHRWMEHGSFDFCLENAILKLVQLGLHGGLPQVRDAVDIYRIKTQKYTELSQKRQNFTAILTANLLSLAGIEDDTVRQYMLDSLDEMHHFTKTETCDIYYGEEERRQLTGIPACWKNRRHFIRQELYEKYRFSYPLIYDIVGLYTLYRLHDSATDRKIDDIIRYLSTDAFHHTIVDGYGILTEGNGVYHSMGWDPKHPGWFDIRAYMHYGSIPKLLFNAQYACRYPAVRETRWFADLLAYLETFQTDGGRYEFPAVWFTEKRGYAVMGSHLSFGENRRKKNWCEIESTFYMQLLKAE